MHLHFGLNQAVHIPVLAVTFFLLFPTAPDTCSCSTGTLAGQTLTKLSECCGTCFTNNYHTICTVSELFSISVSVSLPLSLSLFCASYFSSFFSIHPSHGLMKRRLGEQHGLFVCLTFFVLILLRPGAVMFFHCGSLTAWTSACEHLNNKTHFYEFIPEKLLHHGQRYYWNIGRERKKYLFSKKTSSERGHSGAVNGYNWFICSLQVIFVYWRRLFSLLLRRYISNESNRNRRRWSGVWKQCQTGLQHSGGPTLFLHRPKHW